MNCLCPDEDKNIYEMTDCCPCREHEVNVDRKIVACSYCNLVRCNEL